MKHTRFAAESAAQAQAEAREKQQHTPGPWGVEQTEDCNWIGPMRRDSGKVSEIVCNTERGYLKPERLAVSDANARLIATAPDLFRALKRLISDHDQGLSFDVAWADARTAIAKATGK